MKIIIKVQLIILTILILRSVGSVGQDTLIYSKEIPFDNAKGLFYLPTNNTCPNNFVLPQYSLGNSHLSSYLQKNLKYPINHETGEREYVKGKLIISFVVTKFGKVENLKIIESPHEQVSDQISSAIGKLKPFYPAMCDSVPLEFSLYFKANFMGVE